MPRHLLSLAVVSCLLPGCNRSALTCPPGASLVGGTPPAAYEAYCQEETAEGSMQKHGPYRKWFPSGQIAEDLMYEHNKRSGTCTEWREDGSKRQAQMRDDRPLSLKSYYPGGGLKFAGKDIDNDNSHSVAFREDGTKCLECDRNPEANAHGSSCTLFDRAGTALGTKTQKPPSDVFWNGKLVREEADYPNNIFPIMKECMAIVNDI